MEEIVIRSFKQLEEVFEKSGKEKILVFLEGICKEIKYSPTPFRSRVSRYFAILQSGKQETIGINGKGSSLSSFLCDLQSSKFNGEKMLIPMEIWKEENRFYYTHLNCSDSGAYHEEYVSQRFG